MARKFAELEKKMSPDRVARSKARAKEIIGEMLLAELRRQAGLTQAELAERLGIQQPSLSKLEGQDDMQVSTLRRIVAALGGELEIVADLPCGRVTLSQFHEHLKATGATAK